MAETTKTPRKETAGLLMAIVRTISSSADFEQREKEKARLEKAFKESDKRLDGLISVHSDDLTAILQAFTAISSRVTDTQQRIRAIKDNLQSCKNLLHCKRDELRRLWIEGIEHKTVVGMLDQIERMRDVPERLQGYLEKKHYLHATDLLVQSIALLEGDLAEVDALRDIRAELSNKIVVIMELCDTLVEELHKQIYIKSTSAVVKEFQRSGSSRSSVRKVRDRLLYGKLQNNMLPAEAMDEHSVFMPRLSKMTLDQMSSQRQITEDLSADPEADVGQFISILIESLMLLEKLPEAAESTMNRMMPGLMAIVQRASQQVADNAYLEGEDIATLQQPEFLLELLELIFQEFRIVAHMHEMVLANLRRIALSASHPPGNIQVYNMVDVWTRIQKVVQMLLDDYLDVMNAATAQPHLRTNFDEPTAVDIGAYFAKKKSGRTKKGGLFRFDASSHAISMNSYFREQRQEFYGAGEVLDGEENMGTVGKTQLVCKPGPSNITTIYKPLMKFIQEIEKSIGCPPGTSTVHSFVKDFIKNVFLGQVHYNIQDGIDKATRGFDAQRTTADPRVQRELGAPKPLLQSTVAVSRSMQELQNLMNDLPDFADQFLNMIHTLLRDYREKCAQTYKGITSSDMEDKRIISGAWAKDEDISRFLRCLPNWQILKEMEGETKISEEDMHAMNSKESDILTSNLSSGDIMIPAEETITDVIQLRLLGNLCESLEWLVSRIKALVMYLSPCPLTPTSTQPSQPVPQVSESSLESLESLVQEFQDLGDLCLLVLHLEVRVHCFFYLLPMARQSNYSSAIDDMDPDSSVIKLNKDLTAIEESLSQSTQPRKFRYIFEGLGHLVASILINSTQYLKRINENGIKKMCRNIFAIQQSLTNITMSRESDLDQARQYYELLYLPAEDIMTLITEQGPKFPQLDYVNLMNLVYRSRPECRLSQLPQVLDRLNKLWPGYSECNP